LFRRRYPVLAKGRRGMSELSPHDPVVDKSMRLWKISTVIGTAVCLAWTVAEFSGEHEEDAVPYKPGIPYRNIHLKPLPWADGKTPMFAYWGGWTPEKEQEHGHGHH